MFVGECEREHLGKEREAERDYHIKRKEGRAYNCYNC